MDEHDSWKNTEEPEIDIKELLLRLCRQWKQIIACTLAAAMIFGGYTWQKNRDSPDDIVSDIAGADGQIETEEDVMTEAEKQSVADAVWLKKETGRLKLYMSQSVLMQADPYHKTEYVMLFSIEHAERQELPKIVECYINFLLNGSAADALVKSGSWKIDRSCLAELISAYQKTYSHSYQLFVNDSEDSRLLSDALFYVEITGKNAKEAEKMALDIQVLLKEYAKSVKDEAGSHSLTLVSSNINITADSGLQTLQHDKKALFSSNSASLRTLTDSFSEEQMAVYKKEAGIEDEKQKDAVENLSGESELDEETLAKGTGIWTKYTFLGAAGAFCAYCFIFLCCYLFSDLVKSEKEIKNRYRFPLYGSISISKKHLELYETERTRVLNRIRLACKNKGWKTLCAAADFSLKEEERECLQSIASELKDWEIEMSVSENADSNTAIWDELAEKGGVLMVYRIGITTHQMIDDAVSFYLTGGIAVAGAVVFSQQSRL